MIIKIDLEKAYDHLEWHFIVETLVDVGLPQILVNVIMERVEGGFFPFIVEWGVFGYHSSVTGTAARGSIFTLYFCAQYETPCSLDPKRSKGLMLENLEGIAVWP